MTRHLRGWSTYLRYAARQWRARTKRGNVFPVKFCARLTMAHRMGLTARMIHLGGPPYTVRWIRWEKNG